MLFAFCCKASASSATAEVEAATFARVEAGFQEEARDNEISN
jgi:hypothetical protein